MVQDLLVTIFVPVYNGEKYLNTTLTSILNQTYTNFEVLLVDDSSTDGSKKIINEFVNKDSRFKIFVKENGGMVGISWNFIMPDINGDYVFYSSQDDLLSVDLVEKMVERQQETDADTIVPDMEFYFENEQNNKKIIGLNGDRILILNGKEACTESLNWNIHGFTLTKTSLIRDEFFFEDAFDTDEFITRKLFLRSNKVVFCEGIFYYRQDNSNAITKTFSKKNFYALNTLYRLLDLLRENDFDNNLIFNAQIALFNRYLELSAKFELYDFKSKIEKQEVLLFLSDFKQKQFTNSFCISMGLSAIKSLKLKYVLLLIILKTPILFAFLKKRYIKKCKNQFFLKMFMY